MKVTGALNLLTRRAALGLPVGAMAVMACRSVSGSPQRLLALPQPWPPVRFAGRSLWGPLISAAST
jgi:hypothetical protein